MRDTSETAAAAAAPSSGRARSVGSRLLHSLLPCLRTSLVSGTIALVLAGLLTAGVTAGVLAILRVIDPPTSAVMLAQRLSGTAIDQRWVRLGAISPALIRAVIASEDNQFCFHGGVDLRELEVVLDQAEVLGDDASRGGSTITMQVAKNLFLWNARSYARKAIELPLAFGIETMWPKDRIMEVYLNIAEWGPGIFGVEAAARHYFGKPASRLGEREAALLAVALPNPRLRAPNRASPHVLKVAAVVERRARALGNRAACVLAR